MGPMDLKGIAEFLFVVRVSDTAHMYSKLPENTEPADSISVSLFQVLVRVRERHVGVQVALGKNFINKYINLISVRAPAHFKQSGIGMFSEDGKYSANITLHSLQPEDCLSTQDGGICKVQSKYNTSYGCSDLLLRYSEPTLVLFFKAT